MHFRVFKYLIVLFGFLVVSKLFSQDFDDLSIAQKAEFEKISIELGVLGGNENGHEFGLIGYQQHHIDILLRLYQNQNLDQFQELSSNLYSFNQAESDWTYIMRRNSSESSYLLKYEYQKLRAQLVEPTFFNLQQFLRLEYQQRLFQLNHPIFSSALFYPGLNEWDLSRLVGLKEDPILNEISQELIHKIANNETLSFEEYSSLAGNASRSELIPAYFEYLSLSSVLRFEPKSEEELVQVFQQAKETFLNQFPTVFTAADLSYYQKNSKFYWTIYSASLNHHFTLNENLIWSNFSEDLEDLNALLWLEANYRQQWPDLDNFGDFQEILNEMRDGDFSILAMLQMAIDESLEEDFSFQAEQKSFFKEAVVQIEKLNWLKDPENSKFLKLDTRLRNILCAREFPTLSIRACRALLEDRLIDLSREEIARFPVLFYRSSSKREEYLQKFRETNLINANQARELAKMLVQDYFEMLTEKAEIQSREPQEKLHLYSGEELELVSKKKSQRRAEIESGEYQLPKVYGWLPNDLATWINLQISPYDGFWSDEIKRFENERKRAQILTDYREKMMNTEEDSDEYQKLHEELHQMVTDSEGFPRVDLSSPAVYLADYWTGLRNADAMEIAGSAAAGFVFYFVFKGVGGRWIFRIVTGDTALRIGSAYYYDRDARSLIQIDLDKGFSTPVGYWTAKGLQDSLKTLGDLLFPQNDAQRLAGFYDLGRLTPGFGSFIAGGFVAREFGGRAYGLIRQRSRLEDRLLREIKNLETLKTEIKELELNKSVTQDRLRLLAEGSPEFKKAQQEILAMERKAFDLQYGLISTHESTLSFYFDRSLKAAYRLARKILYFEPKRAAKLNWTQRLNSWRRQKSFGIAQTEDAIAGIEAKLRDLDFKMMSSDSAFKAKAFREKISNYRTGMKAASEEHSAALRNLDRIGELQKKEGPLDFADAQDLQNEFESMVTHLNKMDELLNEAVEQVRVLKGLANDDALGWRQEIGVQMESNITRTRPTSIRSLWDNSFDRFWFNESYKLRQQAYILQDLRKIGLKTAFEGRAPESLLNSEAFLRFKQATYSFGELKYKILDLNDSLSTALRFGRENRLSVDEVLQNLRRRQWRAESASSLTRENLELWWKQKSGLVEKFEPSNMSLPAGTYERLRWDGLEIYRKNSGEYFVGEVIAGEWRLIERLNF